MNNIFEGCNVLRSLPDISKWDIKNAKNISYMFIECKSLQSLPDFSNWDTTNVDDMSLMFVGCKCINIMTIEYAIYSYDNNLKLFGEKFVDKNKKMVLLY